MRVQTRGPFSIIVYYTYEKDWKECHYQNSWVLCFYFIRKFVKMTKWNVMKKHKTHFFSFESTILLIFFDAFQNLNYNYFWVSSLYAVILRTFNAQNTSSSTTETLREGLIPNPYKRNSKVCRLHITHTHATGNDKIIYDTYVCRWCVCACGQVRTHTLCSSTYAE